MIDSCTSVNQTISQRQLLSHSQITFKPDQNVYLYGDINYTGRLIRPIERTYPTKWSVQLDVGGYEAANIADLSLIESEQSHHGSSDAFIPFSEEPQATTSKLEQEIIALRTENARLKQNNEIVRKDLDIAKQVIRRAKDISPLMRISLKRVLRLAHDACMEVQRTLEGWILKMGKLARKFRRLADIWDILSQDDFLLSEVFPKDKLVAIELIRSPRPRKPPQLPEKKTFPLMHPSDIIRNRTMLRVKSG